MRTSVPRIVFVCCCLVAAPVKEARTDVIKEESPDMDRIVDRMKARGSDDSFEGKKAWLAALYHAGRFREVLKAHHGVSKDHDDVESLIILGRAHMEIGEIQNAMNAFARASALNPENAMSLYLQGKTLIEMGSRRNGLELLRKATKVAPTFVDAYYEIACHSTDSEEIERMCARILVLDRKGEPLAQAAIGILARLRK